jgi:hypothetical protein
VLVVLLNVKVVRVVGKWLEDATVIVLLTTVGNNGLTLVGIHTNNAEKEAFSFVVVEGAVVAMTAAINRRSSDETVMIRIWVIVSRRGAFFIS